MNFEELLNLGVAQGASDIHLKPHVHPILRINGALERLQDWPAVTQDDMLRMAKLLLKPEHVTALVGEGREMDAAYTLPDAGRFRVNLYLVQGEIHASVRAIPHSVLSFGELHLPKVLEKLAMERRGMILVTGVTGSGKSTTLAAIIGYMNQHRNDHIITIEDPIEFVHQNKNCVISQREIGADSPTFAQALRAALRQDPNVILVGEMRDAETMDVALDAAEAGYLVLSTLHTLNATETVNRIISTFPPHQEGQIRGQLSAVLQGVVSQRLVLRADGKGRVPAVEVMLATALVRESLRDPAKTPQIPTVIAAGQAQYGMQTFDQSLLALYREEVISLETAMEAASNPDDFALKVRGIFSAGEMTWETGGGDQAKPAVPAAPGGARAAFFRKDK